MSESLLPKTWREAIPYVVWGVLVLGFGLEFVAAFIRAEWLQAAISAGGLVTLMAAMLHLQEIRARAATADARWGVCALLIALVALGGSPWVAAGIAAMAIGIAAFLYSRAKQPGTSFERNAIYPPTVTMGSPPTPLQTTNLEIRISGIEDKIEKIALNVQADIKGIRAQIEQSYNVHNRGYLHLVSVLRAREARKIIRDADAVVLELAVRLTADGSHAYANEQEWITAFKRWEQSLQKIDHIVGEWQTSGFRAFLDIGRTELERIINTPPENIRSERTATRYKTFLIAQERYAADRENLLTYFDTKANELP